MAIKDKLDYLQDTKQAIKTAIQGKGQTVADTDTFRSYADKINAITTGGGGETDETLKELVEGTITEFNDTAGNITKLGNYAFYSKVHLTTVNLPNCISGGYYAFASCVNLSNIYLPKLQYLASGMFMQTGSNSSIGAFTINLPNVSGSWATNGAFYMCSAETINLPKLSILYGSSMFYSCKNLKNINMPLLASFRGDSTYGIFSGCTALEQVEFPSLLSTCSTMFQGCTSLTSVSLPQCSYLGTGTFTGCTKLTDLYAPNLTYLAGNAFNQCRNLSNINVSNCSYVGGGAFRDCGKITSVNLPLISVVYSQTFYSCIELSYVSLPNVKQCAGTYIFAYCSKLTNLDLPKCYRASSSSFTFGYMTGLLEANLPNLSYVTSTYLFANCSALQKINIPKIVDLPSLAFSQCSSLQSLSLKACGIIYPNAFAGCTSLSAIYLHNRTDLSSSATLASTPMSLSSYLGYFGSIYVKKHQLSRFQTATNWAVYSSRITTFVPDGITLEEDGDMKINTKISAQIDCEIGDNLLACFILDTGASFPDDWTPIATGTTITNSTYSVKMQICTKTATATTESIAINTNATRPKGIVLVNLKNKTAVEIPSFNQNHTGKNEDIFTFEKPTTNETLLFVLPVLSGALAFKLSGDYDYEYLYGAGSYCRIIMVHSKKPINSSLEFEVNTTNTNGITFSTIGIEIV